jgi:glycosyltransferase involved in cell wall biosynthesis
MSQTIPVTVVARNEERTIGACLDSLLASAHAAQARLAVRFEFVAVLDDCSDGTRAVVERFREVRCLDSTGGKVEGQRRAFVDEAPFQIFSDADILLEEEALFGLSQAMLEDGALLAAFPRLRPLPPRRRTPLAWALHVYNLRRGFSSQRTWFNGKLFALRGVRLPSRDEVLARARDLPTSRFYDFEAGLLADDILLSRRVLLRGGPAALRETAGCIRYRAPETLRGMYRYYRRLRRELERTDALFPETREVHEKFGRRQADLLAASPLREQAAYALFRCALLACRAALRLEQAQAELRLGPALDPWPAIEETKEP